MKVVIAIELFEGPLESFQTGGETTRIGNWKKKKKNNYGIELSETTRICRKILRKVDKEREK